MSNQNEARVRELMKDEKVRSALWEAKSPDDAAARLLAAAGPAGAGLRTEEVARALGGFERTNYELSEAELVSVVGGLLASDPNTGGHTQCCYHCYTK